MIPLLIAFAQDQPVPEELPPTKGNLAAAEALAQSVDALSRLKTLRGTFTLTLPGKKATQGKFRLAKPWMWEITGVPVEVRCDGTDVHQYDPETKAYEKKPAAREAITYLTGYEGFFTAPPDRIAQKVENVTLGSVAALAVTITPPPGMKSARLFIDAKTKLPRGWSMIDEANRAASLKVNEQVADEAMTAESFKWQPPKDSHSVEQIELEESLLQPGEAAPPAAFGRMGEGQFRLADYLPRAKASLVFFWFEECEACRIAMPAMQTWRNRFKKEDLQVLAINVGDGAPLAEKTLRDRGWRQGAAWTPAQNPAVLAFRVRAYPTIYLIGRDGLVKARWIGWNASLVNDAVQKLGVKPGS